VKEQSIRSRRKILWRQFTHNRLSVVGLFLTGILVIMALFAEVIAPYDPTAGELAARLESPSWHHPFGSDDLGRDVLSRVVYGSRVSLLVGLSVVSISAIAGTLIGSLAGYIGGKADEIVMRLIDILLAFPGLLLAIAVMAVFGRSLSNVIFALSIVGWTGYARLARGQVLVEREKEYILAARALGLPTIRIIFRHLIPNTLVPVIILATLGIAGVIVQEAGLSFLGLGVQPPTPSWGSMINDGRQYFLQAQHLMIFPGIAIMLAVLGFNFIGDGLRDMFDPRSNYL